MNCLIRRLLTLMLAALLVFSCCAASAESFDDDDDFAIAIPKPIMQLHQINISGTMAYVLMDDTYTILIDAGSNITVNNYNVKPTLLDAYIAALGIDHIDAHIVTHWHNDHSYNINYFNDLYGTPATVLYGVSEEKPARFIMNKGVYRQLKDNDEFDIGPFHFKVVGPESATLSGDYNADSLNFIMTYGSRRFLFTGDYMNRSVIERHGNEVAGIDVFQFPHHGLQPWCVDRITFAAVNPKMILLPGNSRGNVRIYSRECGITPDRDIFSMNGEGGNATVLLCDGDTIEVVENQKPGAITRDKHPMTLTPNTTAN